MRIQINTFHFGRLALACFMLLWCCAFYGCDNSSSDGDGQINVHEIVGSPPVIESIEFYRYENGEYIPVEPELFGTDGYLYHFSRDEDISFMITATDPDLDMDEVTISTYDVFDMETGDPLENWPQVPLTGPDVHEIQWCESFDISICHQPEENVTFYLKNVLKFDVGLEGPKQIWLTIDDMGGNSSSHYILYARNN